MTAMVLLLTALAAAPPPGPPVAADTVVALREGDRVVVTGISGSLSVSAGESRSLHATTGHRTDRVVVRRSGSRVSVTAEDRGGRRPIEVSLRVPAWAEVQVEGVDLDVSVEGLDAAVTIGTVVGDVSVARTAGRVDVSTIEGDVLVEAPTGPIRVSAQSDDIVVRGATGEVEASSLDGDIVIADATAPAVRAETQSGDIEFSGVVRSGGRYVFSLHSGDVRLTLPPTLSARVRVSTFHGDFRSDFPVVVSDFESGRAFDFTVGRGDAEIVIEVFDGEVRLLSGGGWR